MTHAIFVSLIWMSRWQGEMIFYVKHELLFDDLKGPFCYFTFDDASKESVDIFLRSLIAYDFFIILFNR